MQFNNKSPLKTVIGGLILSCNLHVLNGMLFTEWYLRDIKMENANKEGSPAVLKETVATAWVDGQNILGRY